MEALEKSKKKKKPLSTISKFAMLRARREWLYGVMAIGAWIFFYQLVLETLGKSLEQIEEHWRSGKTSWAL